MWIKQKKADLYKFVRAAVFCLGLVCMVGALSKVLVLKSSTSKLEPFFEDEGKYDVLFTGISHMMMGVYPLELWQEYGITSFNLGESGNKLPNSYWTIRNALDYSDPKLVVIDVRRMELEKVELDDFAKPDYDRFPLSLTKIETARDLLTDTGEQLEFLFPLLKYHSRWTELTEEDFTGPEIWIDKGAYHYPTPYLQVSVPQQYCELPETEKQEGGAVAVKYLRRLIELCQGRGIEVLLVELPYPADEESQRLANGVADIAKEYGVEYLNFHHLEGVVNFNTDMNDTDAHLNDSGAKKVSAYLGDYIKEHYDIPDRRNDSAYSSWSEVYAGYEQYKTDRIKEQVSLDNYLMLLADENISCCIYIRENTGILKDERMRALLQNVSLHASPSHMEEAAENEGAYFLVVNNKTGGIGESMAGAALETDVGFGPVSYGADASGKAFLYLKGEETDYLSDQYLQEYLQQGSVVQGAAVVITVLDASSKGVKDTALFSVNYTGNPYLSLTVL